MGKLIWIGMIIGSVLGGWLPTLFGAEAISFAGLIGSTIGGVAGIVGAYSLGRRLML